VISSIGALPSFFGTCRSSEAIHSFERTNVHDGSIVETTCPWVHRFRGGAQTYVLAKDLRVLGYYSLAAGSVAHDEATTRVKKGWGPSDPYHLGLIMNDLLQMVAG
jgi:hypothetical protein